MPAAAPRGSSHCRHVTGGAWPRGPGWYVRIAILLTPGLAASRALRLTAVVLRSNTKTDSRSAEFSRTRPRLCELHHTAGDVVRGADRAVRPVCSWGRHRGERPREPALPGGRAQSARFGQASGEVVEHEVGNLT